MTTHAAVAASADVQKAIPALAELAGNIGDRQVRNRGTIGGSLANNDPAACYPAAVLGLGATVHTNTREHRRRRLLPGHVRTALAEAKSSPR
jgi:carbon-monoxide dehydrogenase medium subunit